MPYKKYHKKIKKLLSLNLSKTDKVAGKFVISITDYCGNLLYSLNALDAFDEEINRYNQFSFINMRMIIDCCTEVQALLLVKDKNRYYNKFFKGSPTNQIKISGQALTKSYLLSELEKEFVEINDIYKECCNWIHPSKYIVPTYLFGGYLKEYTGYRGRIYTNEQEENEDIHKDIEYCVDVLFTLLGRIYQYYLQLDAVAKTEET